MKIFFFIACLFVAGCKDKHDYSPWRPVMLDLPSDIGKLDTVKGPGWSHGMITKDTAINGVKLFKVVGVSGISAGPAGSRHLGAFLDSPRFDIYIDRNGNPIPFGWFADDPDSPIISNIPAGETLDVGLLDIPRNSWDTLPPEVKVELRSMLPQIIHKKAKPKLGMASLRGDITLSGPSQFGGITLTPGLAQSIPHADSFAIAQKVSYWGDMHNYIIETSCEPWYTTTTFIEENADLQKAKDSEYSKCLNTVRKIKALK